MGRVREKRRVEERRAEEKRSEKRKSQKKEDAGARKGRKVAKHWVFQWFVAPEGRKVGSLKRPDERWKIARRCGAKHISKSKCTKHYMFGALLEVCDVEKVHAVAARSTFASEKAKNTSRSDHFWKLRCLKSACRCGAKHISKSKCTKHHMFGALLEVAMSKKCTPLWREAHFEVKMLKAQHVRATFGRSGVVSRGRRKGLCTLSKVSKTWGFCRFL